MTLFEIFQYGFMIRAIVAGVIIGIVAPVVGVYLVTRRYAFMAETMAHVSLAGVALGHLFGLPPLASALIASLVAAVGVEKLRAVRSLGGDTILALFLSGGLALSSVLLTVGNGGLALQSLLFGSIATVGNIDLVVIGVLGVAVLILLFLLRRPLFAITFDEELAKAAGVRVDVANFALVALAAVTIAAGMPLVGALLVGALMVIPVAAALQWRVSFRKTMLLSVVFSVLSVLVGIVVSFELGFPSGGSIVLTAIVLFFANSLFRLFR